MVAQEGSHRALQGKGPEKRYKDPRDLGWAWSGCWGTKVRLEIYVELGTLLLSPFPSSLALALQRDSVEMCPKLSNSCAAYGAEP